MPTCGMNGIAMFGALAASLCKESQMAGREVAESETAAAQ